MGINQSAASNKQAEQTEKLTDAVKASMSRTSEQGSQFTEATRNGMSKMADLGAKASDDAKQIVQKNVDTASQQAREASDRFTRVLGFTGQDSERLARQPSRTSRRSRGAARS
ncbi:hypothetical protein LRS73_33350 (plasmid) [Methylobacterium currus]|uniref:hypothetical protein n=1 Tax=Methylobacterium currus TaxID=2051553 RepID=UPI001E2C4EC5|nr:hypothetical protein [Methylobacterium currus]UHC19884.1 hypothetical protein LRS73_33350 [Methylobacterium currus]